MGFNEENLQFPADNLLTTTVVPRKSGLRGTVRGTEVPRKDIRTFLNTTGYLGLF